MTKQKSKAGFMTIPEAAEYLECRAEHVRTLVRKRKFPGMEQVAINSKQWRWEIPIETLDKYKARSKRSRRTDGRTKYNLYARDDEAKRIAELFEKNGVECPFEKAYVPKLEEDEDEG